MIQSGQIIEDHAEHSKMIKVHTKGPDRVAHIGDYLIRVKKYPYVVVESSIVFEDRYEKISK